MWRRSPHHVLIWLYYDTMNMCGDFCKQKEDSFSITGKTAINWGCHPWYSVACSVLSAVGALVAGILAMCYRASRSGSNDGDYSKIN